MYKLKQCTNRTLQDESYTSFVVFITCPQNWGMGGALIQGGEGGLILSFSQ